MRLRLKTTDIQFSAITSTLLAKRTQAVIRGAQGAIERRIESLMRQRLSNDPIIDELQNGVLALDFGLSPTVAAAAVSEMIEGMNQAVSVKITRGRNGFAGIRIIVNPVGAIENIPAGSYDSNGHAIEWMNWLLNKGSEVVVNGFESIFSFNDASDSTSVSNAGESRSGLGFMVPTGGNFRVNPKFAGTSGDNFLTKIVVRSQLDIENIIRQEINKVL
jgi:hypothetical protein